MQRSLAKRLWYGFLQIVCHLAGVTLCRLRVYGREHEPATGGALVLSNHQSHLDPILMGLSCRRRLNFLARESLFAFAPFRWLIRSLDAIPIDRDGSGLSGLKETLRRLKRGELVLVFSEGTRSPDGEIGSLKPGFCALARRSRVPILPVAVTGAYEAWPRQRSCPRPAPIHIHYGPPLSQEEIAAASDEELVAEVRRRIVACHRAGQASLKRAITV